MIKPKDRIIVALDIDDLYEAKSLAERLSGKVGFFKIGLELFTKFGQHGVKVISKYGRIMLDLKFHDIPNTVTRAVKVISGMKLVTFITIHAAGGREMITRACEIVRGEGVNVLGITVLTSLDQADCAVIGINSPIGKTVIKRAKLAIECGCYGIVSSPKEVRRLRSVLGQGPVIISPGIRLGDNTDDQKRVACPYKAIKDGANYLVIGRPITTAWNPVEVVEGAVSEIERALLER